MHVNHSVAGHRCPHIGHAERAKPNLDPARSPRPDCVQLRLRSSLSDCVSTRLVSTSQQLASLPMAPPCDWPLELLQLAALVCQVGIGEDQNAVECCWPFVQPHPGGITIRECGENPSCIASSRSTCFQSDAAQPSPQIGSFVWSYTRMW